MGDILKYINPFDTEYFFGYKLVGLIIDGLKGLFIPSEGYFDRVRETILSSVETALPFSNLIELLRTLWDIETDGQLNDIAINNYNIGNNTQISVPSFIDFSIVTQYRDTWYSWVRGVTFIFLIIYHINQILKLLGYSQFTDGAIRGEIVPNSETGLAVRDSKSLRRW